MRTLVLLTAATILTVAGTASIIKAPTAAPMATSSMSIDEIQRKVAISSLPIVDVTEFY
jgi:hypothetical protein